MSAPTEKLQKAIATTGLMSRRKAEVAIQDGRVYVDGKLATIGDRVGPKAKIQVDGKPIRRKRDARRVLIYNKPIGQVCTRDDPEGRPTIFDDLPELSSGRWINVGRLDYNTSGLMIFTNDGELANDLMHPSSQLDRVYKVRVGGEIPAVSMRRLQNGIDLDDGKASFDKIIAQGDAGGANVWYEVTVSQGRNRIIRRLMEAAHVSISRLIRIEYGKVKLPRDLKAGEHRELNDDQKKSWFGEAAD